MNALAPKPWWKTSYLWVLVCVNLGTIATAAVDLFPPKWVPFITALSAGFYTVARGLVGLGKAMASHNEPPPPDLLAPPNYQPQATGGPGLAPTAE